MAHLPKMILRTTMAQVFTVIKIVIYRSFHVYMLGLMRYALYKGDRSSSAGIR